MKNGNGNRNRRNQGRNRNQRPRQDKTKVFNRGEPREVMFGADGFMMLGDGKKIIPGTRKFRPEPGETYMCSVEWNRDGSIGSAMPMLPEMLPANVWLPGDTFKVELTFTLRPSRERDGEKRPIAFDENGQAVFPEKGSTVLIDKPGIYMLREARWVSYATLVKEVPTKSGMGTLGDAFGSKLKSNLGLVELRTAKHKSGVQNARSEDEVEFTTESRSAHELLGLRPGASAKVVLRAFSEKSSRFKPENILKAWRGGRPPLVIKLNAEAFYKALLEAKEQLLAMAEDRERKKAATDEAKATEETDAKAEVTEEKPAEKPAKPKAKRQPRTRAKAEVAESGAETKESDEAEVVTEEVVAETASEDAEASDDTGEELSRSERFRRKYARVTPVAKTTKAKPKQAEEKKTGGQSLAEQLAALKDEIS